MLSPEQIEHFILSGFVRLDRAFPRALAVGSHLEAVRLLAPHGEQGLSVRDVSQALARSPRREAFAIGPAGTVYLCHPLLPHAAQRHRGSNPRVLAQPSLLPAAPLRLHREDHDFSPVEAAIRLGLGLRA